MAWSVITRDKIDLDSYSVLPFGRFSQAEPFVRALLASDDTVSDLLKLDASAVSGLRRAIVKVSGLPMIERKTDKRTKKGKAIVAKTINADLVRQACESLHVTIEALASTSAEGKTAREYVQVRKVA